MANENRKEEKKMSRKVLVIIPAYNEQESILNTVKNLLNEHMEVDYIVINDCSKDNTLQILQQESIPHVDLPINLGIGGGMQTGYKYALQNDYDIAIQMDGDGQHLPEYIPTLLEPILSGDADLVVGSRFLNRIGFQSSFLRRIGITFLSKLIEICYGIKIRDVTSGFRAANKQVIRLFVEDYAQDYPEPESLVSCALANVRVVEVPVMMKERFGGTSSISNIKSLYYMVKVSLAIILKRFEQRR